MLRTRKSGCCAESSRSLSPCEASAAQDAGSRIEKGVALTRREDFEDDEDRFDGWTMKRPQAGGAEGAKPPRGLMLPRGGAHGPRASSAARLLLLPIPPILAPRSTSARQPVMVNDTASAVRAYATSSMASHTATPPSPSTLSRKARLLWSHPRFAHAPPRIQRLDITS